MIVKRILICTLFSGVGVAEYFLLDHWMGATHDYSALFAFGWIVAFFVSGLEILR